MKLLDHRTPNGIKQRFVNVIRSLSYRDVLRGAGYLQFNKMILVPNDTNRIIFFNLIFTPKHLASSFAYVFEMLFKNTCPVGR